MSAQAVARTPTEIPLLVRLVIVHESMIGLSTTSITTQAGIAEPRANNAPICQLILGLIVWAITSTGQCVRYQANDRRPMNLTGDNDSSQPTLGPV